MKIKERLKKSNTYQKTVRLWRETLDETFRWKFALITNIPGRIGDAMRACLVRRLFGYCGEQPLVQCGFGVENPARLSIGNYVRIARNNYISAGGGVTIGNHVLIDPYVRIWSINHRYDDLTKRIRDQGYSDTKPIVIGDDCWIGTGVQILAGVEVGKGSVIGAGTVLRRSVRPYSIVQGNPGKIVGSRIHEK